MISVIATMMVVVLRPVIASITMMNGRNGRPRKMSVMRIMKESTLPP